MNDEQNQPHKQPAPNPEDGIPDDWNPTQWLAYIELSNGATYTQAAQKADRARGTVARWVSDWRKRYGTELLRNRQVGRTFTDIERIRGGETKAKVWRDHREHAAAQYGETACRARELSDMILTRYLGDPDLIASLTIRDALDLARIADINANRADLLADIAPVSAGTAHLKADVDLSALQRSLTDTGTQETLRAVEVMWARFSEATDLSRTQMKRLG